MKILSEVEIRVPGALVAKELTAPDSYPLSLTAPVIACHQKSNRDPVLNLDDDAVQIFAPPGGELRRRHTKGI